MTEEPSKSALDNERGPVVQLTKDRTSVAAPIQIRDRIKDLRRVTAKDLQPNPKNWHRHPKAQVDALRGLLAEIGYADALLARELPDGKLMLIDGHLRAETTPNTQVPVLVLDVTEEEADKILVTLDPLASMAESDAERIKALLTTVRTESEAVQELFRRTAGDRLWEILHPHEINEVEVAPEIADELILNRVKSGRPTRTASSVTTQPIEPLLHGCGIGTRRDADWYGPTRRMAWIMPRRTSI